jgi:hypothetical protein
MIGGGEALRAADPETYDSCQAEKRRHAVAIRLVPSENDASRAVLEARTNLDVYVTFLKSGETVGVLSLSPGVPIAARVLGDVRRRTRKFPALGIG